MAKSEKILVVNAGSSSLKLAIREKAEAEPVATVLLESLGTPAARASIRVGTRHRHLDLPDADHDSGLRAVLDTLAAELGDPLPIRACGHRVVHGGERFSGATLITGDVLDGIRACAELAPLHNPPSIRAIEAVSRLMPDLPQAAVFDTAFHQTMPAHAYRYAVPRDWYEEHRIRRYGFHGISYQYLVAEAADLLDRPVAELQLLAAHLGNGCSAAAVRNGHGVDTSMGLTPLEGMVMGTRSGDIDPNVIGFLVARTEMTAAEVLDRLQRQSGLLGISGRSHDMREITEAAGAGDADCRLAFEIFCYRAARSLLGLAAGLGRIDALVLAGGIGEHAAPVRARVLDHLAVLSPRLDDGRNARHGRDSRCRITTDDSPLSVLVVPTDEERMIARETRNLLDSTA
ncbi:acetate/propionate family kinase [Haloferula sp. A504]|uniref:acetate/propionate family kinase n=1 Tax=Haloferula sp. A504 TaxID=3373601 RepID=UPI0031C2445E|nr:acetate kinase [Verrucomicrobiaceae bacterium E54]